MRIATEKIKAVTWKNVDTHVFNVTTSTGTILAESLVCSNSGGLGTPPHLRVEAGLIHKANKGVLFIDEIGTLHISTQQQLLTVLQEKKAPITGQSEMSSGAMVRTEPVPADFILVAAGNYETVRNVHPAIRSRIRGSGYEVYMEHTMPNTLENRHKLARFVAQEIVKDQKIPHFTRDAVEEIILEAKRRSERKNHLTLKLRDLGGLIRVAGDLALERNKEYVTKQEVIDARILARTLENQMADQMMTRRKDYNLLLTQGEVVGRVNALAVVGETTGTVHPIEAEIVPSMSKNEGKIIATGQLRLIARESIQNVSALIKKYMDKDISNYDIHVQFLGVYGVEGDSASITIATALLSALENAPVRQDTAMTGSLSVRGEVLPIGGVTAKIEGAIDAGITRIIIPYYNLGDVILDEKHKGKAQIIPVKTFAEVLEHALSPSYKHIAEKFKELNENPSLKKNKASKNPFNFKSPSSIPSA